MVVQYPKLHSAFPPLFRRLHAVSGWAPTRRLCQGIALFALLLLTMLLEPYGTLSAKAAAVRDPMVLIARDATSPSCAYSITPGNHTRSAGHAAALGHLSATRMPCPAGTVMNLETVPLSQATDYHEAYVLPLSPHASILQQGQWKAQVQQLMRTKRSELQSNQKVTPLNACGTTVTMYSGWQVIFNDNVEAQAYYYLNSNCSQVYLDTISLQTGYIPYNNSVWWIEFDYASYRDDCDRSGAFALLYPNNRYSFHPNEWHTAGYDGIYYLQFASSPGCLGGNGPLKTIDMGPFN